jgi:hypothetical protein
VAEKLRIASFRKIEKLTVWNDIINVGDKEEAAEIVNTSNLSPGEKSAMLASWRREDSYRRAGQKEEQTKREEETQDNFLKRVRAGQLTESDILNSILSPRDKEHFLGIIDKRNAAILKGVAEPESDPKLIAAITDQALDFDTPPVSRREILSQMGKGLSVKDTEKLIKMSDVRNTDTYKQTALAIKTQFGFEGMLTGFGKKQMGGLYYNRVVVLWLQEFSKNPQSGTALKQKMYEIAGGELQEYWSKELRMSPQKIRKHTELMRPMKSTATVNIVNPEDVKRNTWTPEGGVE